MAVRLNTADEQKLSSTRKRYKRATPAVTRRGGAGKAFSHTSAHSKKSKAAPVSSDQLAILQGYVSTLKKLEHKQTVPEYKGSSSPTSLVQKDQCDFKYLVTPDTQLRGSITRLFGDRVYAFRFGNVVTISSTGAGIVNSVLNATTLGSTADWSAMTTIFSEFFLLRMDATFMPVSEYNYPLTGVTATSVANLPLGVAQLQHEQPAYTTVSTMANNYAFAFHSTGRPFSYSWVNDESPRSGVVVNPVSGGSVLEQGWCLTDNVSNYTGQIQFLTSSAPPALPLSEVVGNIATQYIVLLRVRS